MNENVCENELSVLSTDESNIKSFLKEVCKKNSNRPIVAQLNTLAQLIFNK